MIELLRSDSLLTSILGGSEAEPEARQYDIFVLSITTVGAAAFDARHFVVDAPPDVLVQVPVQADTDRARIAGRRQRIGKRVRATIECRVIDIELGVMRDKLQSAPGAVRGHERRLRLVAAECY